MAETRIPITPDIIRQSKTLTCDCGGTLFHNGLIFKKISQFVSPTGKEELFPMEVIVCEKCGKIPTQFNAHNIIPEELLAHKPVNRVTGESIDFTGKNRDELSHSTHEEK